MRRPPTALAAGLILTIAALGIVLSGAPVTVAGTNGISAKNKLGNTSGSVTLCQAGGTLPRGATAIRVSLSANIGPRVTVRALSGRNTIAEGSRPAGWGLAETVTVPIKPAPRTVPNVRICTVIGPSPEPFELKGVLAKGRGLLRVEYLRAGPSSWWSLAPTVAEHMGLGRAPTGSWIAWLAIATMLAVGALTSRLALRELQ
jgi:hypothetical protein